jgi:hypothetical protein
MEELFRETRSIPDFAKYNSSLSKSTMAGHFFKLRMQFGSGTAQAVR